MIILEPDGRLGDAAPADPAGPLEATIDALVQAHLETVLRQAADRLAELRAAVQPAACEDGRLAVTPG